MTRERALLLTEPEADAWDIGGKRVLAQGYQCLCVKLFGEGGAPVEHWPEIHDQLLAIKKGLA